MHEGPGDHATAQTRRRYDRLSRYYNLMEWAAERRAFHTWRRQVWSLVEGRQILEVGVGTGKNIPFYPEDAHVIAVDLSPGMLRHARTLADHTGAAVDLREMDVQRLAFPDNAFDSVVTTFVFCSVPDPVKGFKEILRVLRPAGRGVFLEHVLSGMPVVRQAMRTLSPLVRPMMGANIDRPTRTNIEAAGLTVESETDLWLDIVKLFVVRA
ncbi:MAG: class I SAM-dependent methyltransferase [Thermoleophilia bacterium]